MRLPMRQIFIVICICVLANAEASSHRRRKRCYVRLCLKCDLYVNSRGKRSIPDEFVRSPSEDEDLAAAHREREFRMRKWTERDSQKMKIMLEDEEFAYPDDHVNSPTGEVFSYGQWNGGMDDVRSPAEDKPLEARNIHKRSVTAHVGRCLHLLRSRCCRYYTNTATYIGYRVKKY